MMPLKHVSKNVGPSMAGPKPTNDGKSLDKNATNTIKGTQVSSMPLSPNANCIGLGNKKGKHY
jgi:hypothetical protein